MAVRQINTADYDYSMFLETLNKSYKGKADITIDEYDTDAAPDVKVGSVWDDNGAIFILESADLTPTGYAGISNSTAFYLYYDESASVFIYSETVPTWSDAKQGWYNGNDRAFFSMYKDSGGTLYQSKNKLLDRNNIQISGNMILQNGYAMFTAKRITSDNYLHDAAPTQDELFDKLSPFIPDTGNQLLLNGAYGNNIVSRVERTAANTMQLYGITAGALLSTTITDGSAAPFADMSISW